MSRGRHEKRKLKSPFELSLFAILLLALFLTYCLWPREDDKLPNAQNINDAEAYRGCEIVGYASLPTFSTSSATTNECTQDITTSPDVPQAPEPEDDYIYDITDEERELLLKLVHREAGIESIECQIAVLQVVFNRVASDEFEDTIYDVIYSKGQFEPTTYSNFEKTVYNEENVEALERVLKGEKVVSDDVLFFWSTAIDVSTPGTWFYRMHQTRLYTRIDNTYFYC